MKVLSKIKINFPISIVFFIIILGISFRFYHFNHLSYWFDELFSITTSSKNILDFLNEMKRETNPEFYQFVLYIWIKIFGNSPESGRFLSVLFGSITLPITYFLAKKISDHKIALNTLLFLVFSSGAIYYSQETRAYSLLILLSSVSFFYWLEILKNSDSNLSFWSFFIFSLLTEHTHYFGFIFIQTMWVYLFVSKCFLHKKVNFRILFFYILVCLFFLPEIYKLIFIIPELTNVNWIPKPNFEIYIHFFSYIYYFISFKKIPILVLFLLTMVLPIYPLSQNRKKIKFKFSLNLFCDRRVATLFLILSLLLSTFLISQLKPMVTSRNLLVLLVPIYFIISVWLSNSEILKGMRSHLLVLLLTVLSFLSFAKYYYKDFMKEPWRDVSSYAIEKAGKEGYIFTYQFPAYIDYYLVDVFKNKPSIKVGLSKEDTLEFLKIAKSKKIENIVFIETNWDNSKEERYNKQKENLEILKSYSKQVTIKSFIIMQVYHFEI